MAKNNVTTKGVRDSIKRSLSGLFPDSCNSIPKNYLVINDAGIDYYVRALTITSLPKSAVFGVTFPDMMAYPYVDADFLIEPLSAQKMQSKLDRKLNVLQADISNEQNPNNRRRLEQAYSETLAWQEQVETGNIQLFSVKFIFLVYASSLQQLDTATKRFVNQVKGSMTIASCFESQKEAYMSCGPYNTMFDLKRGLLHSKVCKEHLLDDGTVCTFFPHTSFSYSHESGIPVGTVHSTGEPFFHDCFHPTHDGYSMLFAGITGSGKSLAVKVCAARYRELYNTRFACIDTKPVDGRGEYSILCEELRGVNYVISGNSENKLNLFAVEAEFTPDGKDATLDLGRKVSGLTNNLLNILFTAKGTPSPELLTAIETIVRNAVMDAYRMYDIYDGDPGSLYFLAEDGQTVLKKPCPILSDFYICVLRARAYDTTESHKDAYDLIIDAFSDYMDNLLVDATTLLRVDPKDFREGNKNHIVINGTKHYLDGESEVMFDENTPFINFDISGLPDADRDVIQVVVLDYIMENIVRNNGSTKNSSRLVVIVDEAHRTLRQKRAAVLLDDAVRTVRTRMASVWMILQSVRDIEDLSNSESLLRNMAAMWLFKHANGDMEYIQRVTGMTDVQANRVITLGGNAMDPKSIRKGECCVIDNQRPLFVDVAYIKKTEWRYAESDRDKRRLYESHGVQ